MSLTGREHFYDAWHELVVATVSNAPVLDLGTSRQYRKEISVLRGHVPTPYCCLDVAGSKAVDREDLIEVRKRTIHEAIAFDASNSAFELRAEHLVAVALGDAHNGEVVAVAEVVRHALVMNRELLPPAVGSISRNVPSYSPCSFRSRFRSTCRRRLSSQPSMLRSSR
jgi:hypothetical protein